MMIVQAALAIREVYDVEAGTIHLSIPLRSRSENRRVKRVELAGHIITIYLIGLTIVQTFWPACREAV